MGAVVKTKDEAWIAIHCLKDLGEEGDMIRDFLPLGVEMLVFRKVCTSDIAQQVI